MQKFRLLLPLWRNITVPLEDSRFFLGQVNLIGCSQHTDTVVLSCFPVEETSAKSSKANQKKLELDASTATPEFIKVQ